jgi:hypothetical protein
MNIKDKFTLILGTFWCALVAFLLFLYLNSCTPQRRLDRFQRRQPYLFNKANDTILLTDTVKVMIPGTEVDTFLTIQDLHDTVLIQKDNLNVKAYIYHDTLFLSASTDTIYKTLIRNIKVPYTKYIHTPLPRDKLRWLKFLVLLMFCCWILYKYMINE